MLRQVKILLLLLLLMFILLIASGCGVPVVAVVNGEIINAAELEERVNEYRSYYEQQGVDFSGVQGESLLARLRQEVLQQMIDEKLIKQDALRLGLQPSPAQVKDTITGYKAAAGGDEGTFRQLLAANGFNEVKLETRVEENLLYQNWLAKVLGNVKVNDAEAELYYQQHKEDYLIPEKRVIRHILLMVPPDSNNAAEQEAKARAMVIIQQLKAGADFAQLAARYSDDQGSKNRGGLYVFQRGQTDPAFEKAAFSLSPGQITAEPVRTLYGYHIIKVEEIIPAQQRSFSEVKQEIVDMLSNKQKEQKIKEYVASLRAKANIVNHME